MKGGLVLLLFLALAAGGYYLVTRGDGSPRGTGPVRSEEEGGAGAGEGVGMKGEEHRRGISGNRPPVDRKPPGPAGAGGPVPIGVAGPGPAAGPDPSDYSAYPANRYPGLEKICRELGWDAASPETKRFARWMERDAKMRENLEERLERMPGEPEEKMRRFNERAREHRERLREMMGGAMEGVLHEWLPLYRLADPQGRLERVDINGEPVER